MVVVIEFNIIRYEQLIMKSFIRILTKSRYILAII